MDKKIKKTEASIQKLSAHAEKKTCPKDLRYNVRVNITSDQEFKSGISRIRREAKQKLVAALISYHHRRAEKDKIKLKSVQKTHKNSEKGKQIIQNWLRIGLVRYQKRGALRMYYFWRTSEQTSSKDWKKWWNLYKIKEWILFLCFIWLLS